MGAITFSLEIDADTDFSLRNLASKSFKLVHGYFAYDDSASSTAMSVTAAAIGLTSVKGFIAAPKGDVFWQWDPGTGAVEPVGAVRTSVTTDIGAIISTASFVVAATITSVPFLAWGYGK